MVESLAHWFVSLRPTALHASSRVCLTGNACVTEGRRDNLSVLQLLDAVSVCLPISSVCSLLNWLSSDAASLLSIAVLILASLSSLISFCAGDCHQLLFLT